MRESPLSFRCASPAVRLRGGGCLPVFLMPHLGTVRAWPARCDGPALIRGCRVETCSGARCSVEVLLHGAPTDTIFG